MISEESSQRQSSFLASPLSEVTKERYEEEKVPAEKRREGEEGELEYGWWVFESPA